MKRRAFLKKAGIGTATAAAALAVGAPAVIASPKVKWTATSFWNPKVRIMFDMVKNFCQNVSDMTDGQFEIKLYGGGELVPPQALLMPHPREPSRWGRDLHTSGLENQQRLTGLAPFPLE